MRLILKNGEHMIKNDDEHVLTNPRGSRDPPGGEEGAAETREEGAAQEGAAQEGAAEEGAEQLLRTPKKRSCGSLKERSE